MSLRQSHRSCSNAGRSLRVWSQAAASAAAAAAARAVPPSQARGPDAPRVAVPWLLRSTARYLQRSIRRLRSAHCSNVACRSPGQCSPAARDPVRHLVDASWSRASLASSWEMSARSLFARQRVESLRWFPRIRLGRPIAKYFGYRPPPHDSVGRSSGKPRAHDGWHTTGGTLTNIAHECGQHTER